MYYGIEYLIITEILTKLLALYFKANSPTGGGKLVVIKPIVNSLKNLDILIERNNINDRDNFRKIFAFLHNNLLDEFKGGIKCMKDVISDIKNKCITKEELLGDPELLGAINLALGEVRMPSLETNYSNKIEVVSQSGDEILDTVFRSKASNNLKKIFNDKYNMSSDDIVQNLDSYKENINNGKKIDNNSEMSRKFFQFYRKR